MNCAEAQAGLDAWLAGKLSGESSRRIREHLAACPRCSTLLGGIDRIETFTCMDEVVEPSDNLPHRFRAKLLAHRRQQAEASAAWWSKVRNWSRPRQLVAAGAFVVVLVVGIYLGTFRSGEPEPTAAIQEISIAEDLPMLEEMGILRDLDLLEDFDAIQSLSEGGRTVAPVQ